MPKPIAVKMPDEMYDNMMSYASANSKPLTTFCRAIIKQGFLNCLQADREDLERFQRMLADPDKYELSNREKADFEIKVATLKAMVERFEDFRADLAAELYGEGGEDA